MNPTPPPDDRDSPAAVWPLEHLLAVLLRQFRRPLAGRGVPLSDADAQTIAQAVTARHALDERAQAVREALAALVAESESVLAGWGLSFRQSLATGMDVMPGWHTTAEFLELAGEKANAEIRIGAGAALLAALGDLRHAARLFDLVEQAPDEVEAVVARRVLAFLAGVDTAAPGWVAQARAWVDEHGAPPAG